MLWLRDLEAESDVAGNARDRVFRPVGAHDAGGDDEIAAALQQRAPVTIEMGDQFGGREHGIVAQPARHRAGVPGLADALDRRGAGRCRECR